MHSVAGRFPPQRRLVPTSTLTRPLTFSDEPLPRSTNPGSRPARAASSANGLTELADPHPRDGGALTPGGAPA